MTGDDLVTKWKAFVQRYCYLTEQQALTLAVWAIHTWLTEYFRATPYLEIFATRKGAGKTRVLETLQLLVRNSPDVLSSTSGPAIVRIIGDAESKCTILIDEAEKLGQSTLGNTRSMLATGYRVGSVHPVTTGKTVTYFPTYCPKAFASIGNVQPILHDRAIPIELRYGKPTADLNEEYDTAKEAAQELIAELLNWFRGAKVERIPLVQPDWLDGRDREIWAALFSTAMLLKVHKPTWEALQGASVDLSLEKQQPLREWKPSQDVNTGTVEDDQPAAERLLRDLLTVIGEGEELLPSSVIVERLRGIYTSPWRGWRGAGLNEILLSAFLVRFGLEPKQKRIKGKGKAANPVRGYLVDEIRKAAITAGLLK